MFENYDSSWAEFHENPNEVGLEPHEEHYGYPGLIQDLRIAAIRKGTDKLVRADKVLQVLLSRPLPYRRRVASWADQRFAEAVAGVPLRLPIAQHRVAVRALKSRWAEPLQALIGVAEAIARKRYHNPEFPHWHRYDLFEARSRKSRSKARKAWLKANARSDAQKRAEQAYNAKRREARAAKRIAKVFSGAAL